VLGAVVTTQSHDFIGFHAGLSAQSAGTVLEPSSAGAGLA
jgi:hypothetical protein